MPKIILASKSKARQRLLHRIGLKVTVVSSHVRESRFPKTTCRDLVLKNALLKAQDVAKRFSSGIVIGADTIVICGKKVIGKPKNTARAFKTLKILSGKASWVYTGLAVIDVKTKKMFMSCEKTKVHMRYLTDSQIRNYFKRVSPLDKAGAFDIQGLGGVFIDRIEGCFYNVVGLPLSRLAKILEKLKIDILIE